MHPFEQLEPAPVWRHFATLCRIPRASHHEAALRDTLRRWAVGRGLDATVDQTGNLIIRKPGVPGMESSPILILQGHLDMVCQKRAGSPHDFLHDPIHPALKDGWIIAEDTTLGADNGIGVALALAVLEADDLIHGPLEVLLTVDEESGMSGAHGLATDALKGRLMLNLDTEDWGQVYLGCAGGVDVNVDLRLAKEHAPGNWQALRLELAGLTGGHSGVDIHLERGNAIKLLVRALQTLAPAGIRLASFNGGTARNALPRDAEAVIYSPPDDHEALQTQLHQLNVVMREELAGVDEGVTLTLTPMLEPTAQVLTPQAQRCLLATLDVAPQGVRRWSQRVPGVVETSNNLGIARLDDGVFHCNFMVRSLMASAAAQLAIEITGLFELIGAEVAKTGAYPGWAPNPASPLLAAFQAIHTREFARPAEVKVIHAGLECGILAAKYPGLDMISFGPDIRGAHAPGERVNVDSVALVWRLLTALLADLPARLGPVTQPELP